VFDENKWLPLWINARPVEGVAGDNMDIVRQMAFEGGDLGSFAGRLAANDGTEFGCWSSFS
jgi:hypothetical protein